MGADPFMGRVRRRRTAACRRSALHVSSPPGARRRVHRADDGGTHRWADPEAPFTSRHRDFLLLDGRMTMWANDEEVQLTPRLPARAAGRRPLVPSRFALHTICRCPLAGSVRAVLSACANHGARARLRCSRTGALRGHAASGRARPQTRRTATGAARGARPHGVTEGATSTVTVVANLLFATPARSAVRRPVSSRRGRHAWPVIVWLHGGAWRLGDRRLCPDLSRHFAERGFAMVSVDDRLVGGPSSGADETSRRRFAGCATWPTSTV